MLLVSAAGMLHCSADTQGVGDSERLGRIEQAVVGARFGTMCQKDFQNGWQTSISEAWNHCGWFNNQLDNTDQKIFYYNLVGGKAQWENGGDQGALDNVNLFYNNTHGGATTTDAVWAMWDVGTRAVSSSMRLGDEAFGLSIFATYSCLTMKHSDAAFWTRWDDIFRGGLRIAVGSHDTVFNGTTTNETGENLYAFTPMRWGFPDDTLVGDRNRSIFW